MKKAKPNTTKVCICQ